MKPASRTLLSKQIALPLIQAALKEDVGSRDTTTYALIPPSENAKADVLCQQKGVVAGLALMEWTFHQVDPKLRFKPLVKDGQTVHPGKVLGFVEGSARSILVAERVALNFVGKLSGIATLTHAFVERTQGTAAKILDTRKTTPGWRPLERYAVLKGGGQNHRYDLSSQVLIKDNHLELIQKQFNVKLKQNPFEKLPSPVEYAVATARKKTSPRMVVEVEVTNLKEFRQALAAKADIILLDNMQPAVIRECVKLRNAFCRTGKNKKILLEISGGVRLSRVRMLAQTGVDRISVGALTHSAPGLNVSLDLVG